MATTGGAIPDSGINAPAQRSHPPAAAAAREIATQVAALSHEAAARSKEVTAFVLESVLLHEAAAQQLQVAVAGIVATGGELLAASRQLASQVQELRATCGALREAREALQAPLSFRPLSFEAVPPAPAQEAPPLDALTAGSVTAAAAAPAQLSAPGWDEAEG